MYERRVARSGVSIPVCLYMPDLRYACAWRVSDIHLQADRSMRCGDGRRADTVCHKRLFGPVRNSTLSVLMVDKA